MPESRTITITESINAFIEFIRRLKDSIKAFRESFDKIYNNYVAHFVSLNDTKRKKHDGSFRKIERLYEKINKSLRNYMNDFSKEYTETLSLAVEINALAEEFNSFKNRYPKAIIDRMGADELYRRSKRLTTIAERHNKLANSYNGRIHRFNALLENLKNETLVYEYSKKKKSVTMSVRSKLNEFNQLVNDGFTAMGLFSFNVTSDFLKNAENILGSTDFPTINPNQLGNNFVDPQSWFTQSAPGDSKPDLKKYEENSKIFREREDIMQKSNLITKAKTLIDFGAYIAAFNSEIKETALTIVMDYRLLCLPPNSNVRNEFKQMLEQHPFLAPNSKLPNGMDALIDQTQKLEEKVIEYLKIGHNNDDNKEDSIEDVFDFSADSTKAGEVFKYYKKKEFILWLQHYFAIYKRDEWIKFVLSKDLDDEFLNDHINYFKRVHGFTEAIAMEEFIANHINKKMIELSQKIATGVDDLTPDDPNHEKQKELCESFKKISDENYLIFADKLEAAVFKQRGKKNQIHKRIQKRQERLKSFNDDHEKLRRQYLS